MKKILLASALVGCVMSASGQDIIERPTAKDNWQVGVDAGLTTPLKGHSFFSNMRPTVGLHIGKQFTPLFGMGLEGLAGINTSRVGDRVPSKNAFDNTYVGVYGTYNLTNALMGFSCQPRPFTVETLLGVGWGRDYVAHGHDDNYLGAKAGMNFNFNVSPEFTIALKPSVVWNVSGATPHLDARRANFNLAVGFNYNINPGFKCVALPPDNSAEIAELNSRVNTLRADLNGKDAALAAANAKNQELASALAAANAKPAQVQVVKENTLTSVRYVFFRIGSSVITADQMPNVEMIAEYMKNHPKANVQIRGYASKDGNLEFNEKLAAARAQSVKNALVKKYGIKASRINAEGEGIGTMFAEESWNRVSICTLDAD